MPTSALHSAVQAASGLARDREDAPATIRGLAGTSERARKEADRPGSQPAIEGDTAMVRSRVRLLSIAALGGLAALALGVAARSAPTVVGGACTASSVDEIQACLGDTRGTRILIAPGAYGALVIANSHKPIVLEAADPARRPRFTSALHIAHSSALTIRNFEVVASADVPIQIDDSDHILIDRFELHSADQTDPARYFKGAVIRGGKFVRVTNGYFHDLSSGIAFANAEDSEIGFNLFTRIRDDSIAGGYTNRLKITGNVAYGFNHVGNVHPDYIQRWANWGPNIDNQIINNIYVRGVGGTMSQCVFGGAGPMPPSFGNQPSDLRTVIKGNICIGADYNGVSLYGGRDAVMSDNICVPGPDHGSWVLVRTGNVLELDRNIGFTPPDHAVNIVPGTVVGSQQGNIRIRPLTSAQLDKLGADIVAMAQPGTLAAVYEPFRAEVLETIGLRAGPRSNPAP